MLSNSQVQALKQLIEVSIGIAARSLSEIVDTDVALQIPELEVLSAKDRVQLDKIFNADESYVIVKQDFQGNLKGTTALAFSNESALRLVSLITDTAVSEDEIDIMQTGTLLEVGNIINNAFLGTLNDQFNFQVNYKLPEFNEVKADQIIRDNFARDEDGLVIIANTKIIIKLEEVEGHLLLLFKVVDLEFLKQKLNDMAQTR